MMKNLLLYIAVFAFLTNTSNAQSSTASPIGVAGNHHLTNNKPVVRTLAEMAEEKRTYVPVNTPHPMRAIGASASTAAVSGYLTEGFEGSTFPPSGWQVVDAQDPLNTFVQYATNSHSGAFNAYCNWSPQTVVGEDWLITPQFHVISGDSLTFFFSPQVLPYPPDSLYILVSTTDSALTSFTNVVDLLIEGVNYPTPAAYWYYSYPLTAFAGQDIYVAFQNVNIWGDGIHLDDITMGTKPPDAASESIDVPLFAPTGGISPKATFKNDGDSIISFPVTMTISGGYSSTKNISNLNPGVSQQVTFDPFTPSGPGSYFVTIETALVGDTHLSNDTLSSSILFMDGFTNYGWSVRAPLPDARQGAAVGAINDNVSSKMYVSGGYKPTTVTDSTNLFMPVNNAWSPSNLIGKMVKPAYLASAATVKNNIYVAGGYNIGLTPVNNTQVFDPVFNTWGNGFSMSSPVGDYAVGVFNDSIIYYIGGYSGSVYRNTVQLFVPSGFLWIPGNNLPTAAAGLRGGIIGNKIVVTGGFNANGNIASTFVGDIDPANPYIISWTQVNDYPSGPVSQLAGGASLDAASGLVLFTGGNPLSSGTGALDYTFAYDVNVNQWKVGPPKPTPANTLCNFTAVVDNDSLYMVAVGGNGPNGPLTANEWLNLGPYQVVVGVGENTISNVLLNVSPNPFTDIVNIQFSLDKKAMVKASIVDVLGNELTVLSNKEMKNGVQQLTWDASNFAKGVYICRLIVDGRTTTQKILKY